MTKRRNGRIKGFYTDGKGRRRLITSRSLYRNGARYRERKKFEREYGKKRGDYIYGATVGKVRMERETGRSRAATVADLERKAEHMVSDGKPVKLIALKRRHDGLFYSYMQSFNNWEAASKAATALKIEGYDVMMVRKGA